MTTTPYEEFSGYPLFNDTINPTLRAWNRLNVIFNMKEFLKNNKMAVNYMKQFDKADKFAIALVAAKITRDGYENTRREIMRKANG